MGETKEKREMNQECGRRQEGKEELDIDSGRDGRLPEKLNILDIDLLLLPWLFLVTAIGDEDDPSIEFPPSCLASFFSLPFFWCR